MGFKNYNFFSNFRVDIADNRKVSGYGKKKKEVSMSLSIGQAVRVADGRVGIVTEASKDGNAVSILYTDGSGETVPASEVVGSERLTESEMVKLNNAFSQIVDDASRDRGAQTEIRARNFADIAPKSKSKPVGIYETLHIYRYPHEDPIARLVNDFRKKIHPGSEAKGEFIKHIKTKLSPEQLRELSDSILRNMEIRDGLKIVPGKAEGE